MVLDERSIQIVGSLDEVAAARDFVVQAARDARLDDRSVHHCELVVDEACTNIVEHAYGLDGGDAVIDIICRREAHNFIIILLDDGPAFDPLATADPDPLASLEVRKPGGWGTYFIKQLMDEVYYDFTGSRNQLTMIRHLD